MATNVFLDRVDAIDIVRRVLVSGGLIKEPHPAMLGMGDGIGAIDSRHILLNTKGWNHFRYQYAGKKLVYFFIGANGEILYVGRTGDIRSRFAAHQKLDERTFYVVFWVPYYAQQNKILEFIETCAIDLCKPELNGTMPDPHKKAVALVGYLNGD